jgi:hypothetical protein
MGGSVRSESACERPGSPQGRRSPQTERSRAVKTLPKARSKDLALKPKRAAVMAPKLSQLGIPPTDFLHSRPTLFSRFKLIAKASRCRHRMRGRAHPIPVGPHQLGTAAQAGVRHRHAYLPELRRRGAEDHRGHPRAAGDREDPDAPGLSPDTNSPVDCLCLAKGPATGRARPARLDPQHPPRGRAREIGQH